MKNIKKVLGVFALSIAFAGAFAFTQTEKVPTVEPNSTMVYFELIENGNKLNRTHWVESTPDAGCPEEVTIDPCRILAEQDGLYPSNSSFSDILSVTDDFTEVYEGRVTYKP